MAGTARPIALPDDLQAFAEERVRAGEYASIDEVATAAVRLLRQQGNRLQAAREELAAIFREMEAGTYVEPTDEEFEQAVRERALSHTAG